MGLTYTQVNTLHNTLLNGAFTNSGCLTIIMMQHQAIYLLLTRCMQGYNIFMALNFVLNIFYWCGG